MRRIILTLALVALVAGAGLLAAGPSCRAVGFCPSFPCYSSVNCGPTCQCLQTAPPAGGVCVSLR